MSANVALSDTFDLWRTRTNQLLMYTQTAGGIEQVTVANTSNATSNTTGAITTTGGISAGKSVVIGENLRVFGSEIIETDLTINGNTQIGGLDDIVTITALVDSDIIPNGDAAENLGNSTFRWNHAYVNGVAGSNSSASLTIPSGTTAEGAGAVASIRWNTEKLRFEGNTGTIFQQIGRIPQDTDGDTRIELESGSNDEDIIRFWTGNASTQSTERMNLGTSGNLAIGMGSTLGDAMLKVEGTANVTGVVNHTNRTNMHGNVSANGAWVNASPTTYFHVHSPDTVIDSNNVVITGNLVVQGTRTYNDTSVMATSDKTLVLGAGSNVFSNSSSASGTVTSKRNGETVTHGLSTGDRIFIVRAGDSGLTDESVHSITVATTSTFTINSYTGSGTFDFCKSSADSVMSGSGLLLPGNTVHSLLWSDGSDEWILSNGANVAGPLHVQGAVLLEVLSI